MRAVNRSTNLVLAGLLFAALVNSTPPEAQAADQYWMDIRATQVGDAVLFEWDPIPSSAWPAPQAGGPWTSLTYWPAATLMEPGTPQVFHYCNGSTRLRNEIPPPPQTSRSCLLTGLEPGRAYNLRVSGWLSNAALHTNAVGFGDLHAQGGFTLCCGAPGSPSDVRLLDVGGGEALAVWSPSTRTGGASEVQYRVDLDAETSVCTTSATECRIRDLEFGRDYVATVSAITSGGQSAGVSSTPVRLIPPVPRAPRKVTATSRGQSVVVRWQPPNLAPGQRILGYQVFADPGTRSCRTSKTRCRISGLEPGRSYTFEVVATDDRGRKVAASSRNSILIPRPTARPAVEAPSRPVGPSPEQPESTKPEQEFS